MELIQYYTFAQQHFVFFFCKNQLVIAFGTLPQRETGNIYFKLKKWVPGHRKSPLQNLKNKV